MLTLVVWALATAGATLIVTTSWLFAGLRARLAGAVSVDPERPNAPDGYEVVPAKGYYWPSVPRPLGILVHCPMCLGFWMGCFFAVALMSWHEITIGLLFALGCAGSVVSWFAYLAHRRLDGASLLGD